MASKQQTKRSVKVHGVSTSVSLEQEFWDRLKWLAGEGALNALVDTVDEKRGRRNLSSALRVYCLREMERLAGVGEMERLAGVGPADQKAAA